MNNRIYLTNDGVRSPFLQNGRSIKISRFYQSESKKSPPRDLNISLPSERSPRIFNAITYKMRKEQIFSPILPKTREEFEYSQHLKADIFNLEKRYLRGKPHNDKKEKFVSLNKTMYNQQPKQINLIRKKKFSIHSINEQMQDNSNISTEVKVTEPEIEQDTSLESLTFAIKDTMRQTKVYQNQREELWSRKYQTELQKSIQGLKSKWKKLLDDDQIYENFKQKEMGLGWSCEQVGILDLESLNYVKHQFKLPHVSRNYTEVDRIVSNLRFFSRFPKEVRMAVVYNCEYVLKKPGEFIFHQNDPDSEMYIIMRGSVNIRQKQMTSFRQLWDILIMTLYDGQQVGDLSQIENNKRTITAVAVEECHLFVMQRSQYESVLLKAVEREMEEKIRIILTVNFLKSCKPIQLIPLAAVLQSQTFEMGQYLIKQQIYLLNPRNQEIPCLFFINDGCCEVVYEKRSWRETKNMLISTQRTRFLFKEQKDNNTKYTIKEESDYEKKSLKLPPNKSFDHSNKQKINDNIFEISEHIHVSKIQKGDVIGGRIIFSQEKLEQKKRRNPSFEYHPIIYDGNLSIAKLSVIASSITVDTFTLDQKQFSTLPEALQSKIRNGLSQQDEFDEIILKDVTEAHFKWSTLKQAYYKGLCQHKKNIR